jgi:hypothetical protein
MRGGRGILPLSVTDPGGAAAYRRMYNTPWGGRPEMPNPMPGFAPGFRGGVRSVGPQPPSLLYDFLMEELGQQGPPPGMQPPGYGPGGQGGPGGPQVGPQGPGGGPPPPGPGGGPQQGGPQGGGPMAPPASAGGPNGTDYDGNASSYLKQLRAPLAAEIQNTPGLKDAIVAMALMEDANHPIGPIESLFNRASFTGQSLQSLVNNSFYEGNRTGATAGFRARVAQNPGAYAAIYSALDDVVGGSNVLRGATDQGSPGDPNTPQRDAAATSGLINPYPGNTEIYNDWNGPGGRAAAAAWREKTQAAVQSAGWTPRGGPQGGPQVASNAPVTSEALPPPPTQTAQTQPPATPPGQPPAQPPSQPPPQPPGQDQQPPAQPTSGYQPDVSGTQTMPGQETLPGQYSNPDPTKPPPWLGQQGSILGPGEYMPPPIPPPNQFAGPGAAGPSSPQPASSPAPNPALSPPVGSGSAANGSHVGNPSPPSNPGVPPSSPQQARLNNSQNKQYAQADTGTMSDANPENGDEEDPAAAGASTANDMGPAQESEQQPETPLLSQVPETPSPDQPGPGPADAGPAQPSIGSPGEGMVPPGGEAGLAQANQLIYGATGIAQQATTQAQKDMATAQKEIDRLNAALEAAYKRGDFNMDYYVKNRREALERQKAYDDAYATIFRNPPQRSNDDLAVAMGAATQAMQMLGGAAATLPAGAAMSALAAAINARVDHNDKAYAEAWKNYINQAHLAAAGATLESNLLQNTIKGQNADVAAAKDKLYPLAQQFNNTALLDNLNKGNWTLALHQIDAYAKVAKNYDLTLRAHDILEQATAGTNKDLEAFSAAHNNQPVPDNVRRERQAYRLRQANEAAPSIGGKPESAAAQKTGWVMDRAHMYNLAWDADPKNANATDADRDRAYSDNQLRAEQEYTAKTGGKPVDPNSVSAIAQDILNERAAQEAAKGNPNWQPTAQDRIDAAQKAREAAPKTSGTHLLTPVKVLLTSPDGVDEREQTLSWNPAEGRWYDPETQKPFDIPTDASGARWKLDPAPKEGVTAQNIATRLQIAGNEISKVTSAMTALPMGTSLGWFGGAQQALGGGLVENFRKSLANRVTDSGAQLMATLSNGVGRSLAQLAAGGVSQGVQNLAEQMSKDVPQKGDSGVQILMKFADMRQIFDAATEVMIKSPNLNQGQRNQLQGIIDQVHKSIPYTTADVVGIYNDSLQHKGEPSVDSVTRFAGKMGLGVPTLTREQFFQGLKDGTLHPGDPFKKPGEPGVYFAPGSP